MGFGSPENKRNKFQDQELDDDFGINYYEFKYRNHDPQIGRFIQIDPLANKYVYNSTFAFSENKVISHVELEGLESKPAGKPIIGTKFTDKISYERDILNSGMGDKFSLKTFTGQTLGESGVIGTMKISNEMKLNENGKTKIKTQGATSGFLTFTVGDDKSLQMGVDLFGYEAHIGVDLASDGIGLTAGGSHTNKQGQVSGADARVQAGGGTLLAIVAIAAKTILPVLPIPVLR